MPNPSTLTSDEEYPETGQYSPTDPAVVRPVVDGIEEQEEKVPHTLTPLSKEQESWGLFNKAAVPGIESQDEPGT